ncbi:MAG: DUF2225 domain-containing protein [Lachnospiraceae bacterium]|nr:DUF2225 domain-containing protein [Lachnospiraceae bacterium]MBQ8845727.1 DUF2225 domain-containing protein [Lachnospiraceae bacterium]
MSNLLSGLEALGLGGVSDMEVYEDVETKTKREKKEAAGAEAHERTEIDYLFEKTHTCPVCDEEFKSSAVRTGKAKLIGTDTDLRPRYQGVDPLKYDAIVCPRCGYAGVNRFFTAITTPQAKLVLEHISKKFNATLKLDGVYSYDDAILFHRLALASAVVKRSKLSERAYTCLKTAWLLRAKQEDETTNEKEKSALHEQEQEFLSSAYDGFAEAMSKETFPICGMDENTMLCMLADIGRRVGHYEDAGRLISRVIVSRTATERIKNKAREIKDLIVEDLTKANHAE